MAGRKNQYGLTDKEEGFVQSVVKGETLSDALRKNYDTKRYTNKTLWEQASKVGARPNVSARIDMLKAEAQRKAENTAVWTRVEALERLRRIAEEARQYALEPIYNDDGQVISKRHNAQAASVELKAVEQASKMCGFNEPDKVEEKIEVVIGGGADDFTV